MGLFFVVSPTFYLVFTKEHAAHKTLYRMKFSATLVMLSVSLGLAAEFPNCKHESAVCIIACPQNACKPGYVCCTTGCGGRICQPVSLLLAKTENCLLSPALG